MPADQDDDTVADAEPVDDEATPGAETDAEPDVDDLDEDEVFVADDDDDDDDDDAAETDESEEDDEDDGDDTAATTTRKKAKAGAGEEEEEEEDDILSPDDVEADLDRILKDRMVTAEEEEDEDDEPDERVDPNERLQPKRADEQLCSNCFLLVRAIAPGCPVGDDDCPIFT